MGSDIPYNLFLYDATVSIHAPTWGATESQDSQNKYNYVSIHAPTWGATSPTLSSSAPSGFNPRSHMGSDKTPCESTRKIRVSIHAPTWGATEPTGTSGCISKFQSTLPHGERHPGGCNDSGRPRFNPRSHMGSDGYDYLQQRHYRVSIHAPTWGATPGQGRRRCKGACFNPRSHMGSDNARVRQCVKIQVSIHAPTWGATPASRL